MATVKFPRYGWSALHFTHEGLRGGRRRSAGGRVCSDRAVRRTMDAGAARESVRRWIFSAPRLASGKAIQDIRDGSFRRAVQPNASRFEGCGPGTSTRDFQPSYRSLAGQAEPHCVTSPPRWETLAQTLPPPNFPQAVRRGRHSLFAAHVTQSHRQNENSLKILKHARHTKKRPPVEGGRQKPEVGKEIRLPISHAFSEARAIPR